MRARALAKLAKSDAATAAAAAGAPLAGVGCLRANHFCPQLYSGPRHDLRRGHPEGMLQRKEGKGLGEWLP